VFSSTNKVHLFATDSVCSKDIFDIPEIYRQIHVPNSGVFGVVERKLNSFKTSVISPVNTASECELLRKEAGGKSAHQMLPLVRKCEKCFVEFFDKMYKLFLMRNFDHWTAVSRWLENLGCSRCICVVSI